MPTAEKKVSRDYSEPGVEHETVLEEKQPTERKIQEHKEKMATLIEEEESLIQLYISPWKWWGLSNGQNCAAQVCHKGKSVHCKSLTEMGQSGFTFGMTRFVPRGSWENSQG